MKKITVTLALLIFLPFISKHIVVGSITIYQKYVSPNKGWKCAYAIAHPDNPSCSEFGKRAINALGIIAGWKEINNRFKDCAAAYSVVNTQKGAAKAGCCGTFNDAVKNPPPMVLVLVDGSKSEGTLTFAYEYDTYYHGAVQWEKAQQDATERCKAWGFTSASFFGSGLETCLETREYVGCVRARVVQKCQCKN